MGDLPDAPRARERQQPPAPDREAEGIEHGVLVVTDFGTSDGRGYKLGRWGLGFFEPNSAHSKSAVRRTRRRPAQPVKPVRSQKGGDGRFARCPQSQRAATAIGTDREV